MKAERRDREVESSRAGRSAVRADERADADGWRFRADRQRPLFTERAEKSNQGTIFAA
jgi:hypothetical protein